MAIFGSKGSFICTICGERKWCNWALGFGLWALGFGLWALGFGLWALGFGLWALGFTLDIVLFLPDGFSVQATGIVIWDDKHGKSGLNFQCKTPEMRHRLNSCWIHCLRPQRRRPMEVTPCSDRQRRMAEREGFEPPIPVKVYTLSRRAPSTTRPSLRKCALNILTAGKLGFGPSQLESYARPLWRESFNASMAAPRVLRCPRSASRG